MSEPDKQVEAQPVSNEPVVEEQQPTTTNEPVEGGSVAAAAEDALLTNVTPTIFTALSFIAFVLFVIGTPLPWLRSDVTSRQQISLWSYEVETASGSQVTEVADFGCDKMKEYFRGAEAFSIITIFVSAVTVLVGVLTRFRGTSAKPLGTVFAFLTALSSIICWGIGFAAYRRDFCGQPTFDQQRFYVYTGAGLFVAGWVVSILALVISLKDIKVPKALPEAAVIKLVATLFTIVALAAFIFTVIATPVTTFSKWTSTTVESRVSIWHTYTYTNGVQTAKTNLHDSTCGDLKRYAGLAEAFHIITIFTTLVAVVAGAGALRGAGGLKGVIAAGLFATTTAIVATAADLAIFYKNFCSSQPTLDAQHYHRDAGFALIATTMVILAAVTLLAISAAVLQLCSSKPEGGNVSKGSFLYIFGTIVSIVFLVVALTVPVLSREANGNNWAKIMWWETQTRAGTSFKQAAFQCQKVWQRLVGGGSIIIVAISFSTFGAILGVAQLSNGALTTAASAIGYFSAVLQLIAFALAISAWRTTFCGVNFKDANFEYDIGFALVPASFCITAVVATLNLVFKA